MSQTVSDCFGSFAFEVADTVAAPNGSYLGVVIERLQSEFGGAQYIVRNEQGERRFNEFELTERLGEKRGNVNVN